MPPGERSCLAGRGSRLRSLLAMPWGSSWERRSHSRAMAGVYISYPFCAQKCTYCNFASGVFPAALEPRYLDAVRAELRNTEWQWTPETVYLGGGTPSL